MKCLLSIIWEEKKNYKQKYKENFLQFYVIMFFMFVFLLDNTLLLLFSNIFIRFKWVDFETIFHGNLYAWRLLENIQNYRQKKSMLIFDDVFLFWKIDLIFFWPKVFREERVLRGWIGRIFDWIAVGIREIWFFQYGVNS